MAAGRAASSGCSGSVYVVAGPRVAGRPRPGGRRPVGSQPALRADWPRRGRAQPTSAQQFDTDAAGYLYVVGFAAVIFILVPALMAGVKTGRVRDSVNLEYLDAPDFVGHGDRAGQGPCHSPAGGAAHHCRGQRHGHRGMPISSALVPGTRRLYVGLPLLLGLGAGGMRAVIVAMNSATTARAPHQGRPRGLPWRGRYPGRSPGSTSRARGLSSAPPPVCSPCRSCSTRACTWR